MQSVENFEVSVEAIETVLKERKNWTLQGIDGIYTELPVEEVKRSKGPLCNAPEMEIRFEGDTRVDCNRKRGHIAYKTENLSPRLKTYRAITCLNILYKS